MTKITNLKEYQNWGTVVNNYQTAVYLSYHLP